MSSTPAGYCLLPSGSARYLPLRKWVPGSMVCFARRSWHAFSVPVRGEADFCLSVRSVAGSVGERYPQLQAVIEEPDTAAMTPHDRRKHHRNRSPPHRHRRPRRPVQHREERLRRLNPQPKHSQLSDTKRTGDASSAPQIGRIELRQCACSSPNPCSDDRLNPATVTWPGTVPVVV